MSRKASDVTLGVTALITFWSASTQTSLAGVPCDPLFVGGAGFAVGDEPLGITSLDFDLDGDQDLVTANASARTISLLENNGSGLFLNIADIDVGQRVIDITSADLDGNGAADLAAPAGDAIVLLFNDGAGDFSETTLLKTAGAVSITSADFDGNAHADLATANYEEQSATVFFGDGTGSFPDTTTVASPAFPSDIAAGHLNDDILMDLVVCNTNSDDVSIVLNEGVRVFAPRKTFRTGASPRDAAIADFDHDALADVAVANFFENNITVLKSLGGGEFSLPMPVASARITNPVTLKAADFNGDQPRLRRRYAGARGLQSGRRSRHVRPPLRPQHSVQWRAPPPALWRWVADP